LAYTVPTNHPGVLRYSLLLPLVADKGDLDSYLRRYRTPPHGPIFQVQEENSYNEFVLKARPILLIAFRDLARAVRLLQENVLRHRDIKPHNVLIHGDYVMLSDFGLSQIYEGDDGETLGSSGPAGINNHRYRVPEVIDGRTRSEKTDVYSLGCTFVEIVDTLMGEACKVNPWPEERTYHFVYAGEKRGLTRLWCSD
jgi:serine/threonine protein kinase